MQAVAGIRDHVVDRPAARGVLKVDAVALAGDAVARDEVLGRAIQVDAVAAATERQVAKPVDLVVGNFVPPRVGDDDAVEHAPHAVVDDAIAVGPHLDGRVHLVGLADAAAFNREPAQFALRRRDGDDRSEAGAKQRRMSLADQGDGLVEDEVFAIDAAPHADDVARRRRRRSPAR